MEETEEFRSTAGRVLTIASAVIAVAVLVTIVVSDGWIGLLHFGAIPLLFAALVWAIFDKPFLRVSDGGLDIGNVFRRIHVPWPAVTDLDLKWGLRVVTAFGNFTAWSVPAPKKPSMGSALSGRRGLMTQRASQPAASLIDSDSPDQRKGRIESAAAAAVTKRWDKLKAAGYLENPRLDAAEPSSTWNMDVVGICGILVLLVALGIATYA